MDRDQVLIGADYWWNMPPREDGSTRRSIVRVTSQPRLERVGRDGNREDYVVDAVFLRRDGTNEQTRYPVQVYFLQPVAYAQSLKKGEVVYWQRNNPDRGNYYVEVTVDGNRNEATGKIPVLWHHDKPSHDNKPAGDSRHDVANRYLFRKEAADVLRATQPSAPQTRTASSPNASRSTRQTPPTSDVTYATEEDLRGLESDGKITAKAALVAMGAYTPKPEEKAQLLKHLSQMAGVVS